jgi:hypothetical protein
VVGVCYSKFGDDGEGNNAFSANTKFFYLDIIAEEISAAVQATGIKGMTRI